MTPFAASKKQNEKLVWANSHGSETATKLTFMFAVGDSVRITEIKDTFDKSYTPRWTEEVFTVSQLQYTDSPTYKTTDNNGEEIQGTFYEQELQETSQEP
jgi:hypothetical protein